MEVARRRGGLEFAVVAGLLTGCEPSEPTRVAPDPAIGAPPATPALGGPPVLYAGRPAEWWVARLEAGFERAIRHAATAVAEPGGIPALGEAEPDTPEARAEMQRAAEREHAAQVAQRELSEAMDALAAFGRDASGAAEVLARWVERLPGPVLYELDDVFEALGSAADPVLPALCAILRAPPGAEDRRQAATDILEFIGTRPELAISALIHALGDPTFDENIGANHPAMAAVQPYRETALPFVLEALRAGGRGARGAIVTLGALGAAPTESVPALLDAMGGPDPSQVSWARQALSGAGADAIGTILDRVATFPAAARDEARGALSMIARETPDARRLLEAARADDPRPMIREVLASVLRWVDGRAADEGRATTPTGPFALEAPRPDPEQEAQSRAGALAADGAGGTERLAAMADSTDPHARRAAIRVLADLGPEAAVAIPVLERLLAAGDDVHAVSLVLAAIGPAAHDAIRRALAHPEHAYVMSQSLGRVNAAVPTDLLPAVIAALGSERLDEEATAAMLARFGPIAVEPLLAVLADPAMGWQGHKASLLALTRLAADDARVVPGLAALLGTAPRGRSEILYALRGLGAAAATAVPALRVLLEGDRPPVDAIETLEAIGPAASDALPIVRRVSEEADGEVQVAAWRARAAMGEADGIARVGAWLREAEPDRDSRLRAALATGAAVAPDLAVPHLLWTRPARPDPSDWPFGDVGAGIRLWGGPPLPAAAIPALTDAARRGDERAHAIAALREFGPVARSAAPVLSALARAGDAAAREALSRIGGPEARVLWETLDAAPPQEVATRITEIAALGPDAAPAVPRLIARLGDRSRHLRGDVIEALVAIGPAAVPALCEALDRPDAIVRTAAIAGLAAIGDIPAAHHVAIHRATQDPDGDVRRLALPLLERLQGPPHPEVSRLRRRFDSVHPNVRRDAAYAAGGLREVGRPLLPDLAALAADADHGVAEAARQAIAAIRAVPGR